MRALLTKYCKVDNETLLPSLIDPVNLRGTWLPKVLKEGIPMTLIAK